MKKAVCLLSGGLDSATALYAARGEGYELTALSFDYGQRHRKELEAAKKITLQLRIPHSIIPISLPWGGSALVDTAIPIPLNRDEFQMNQNVPMTYVPARNSIFLTFAASCAEAIGAGYIFIGANAIDYSGYPDCRPEYFQAFERLLQVGTKAGVEGRSIQIKAPLLTLNKKEIVLLGKELGVPFGTTWSCYTGGETPCGQCDSCLLRAKGFCEAGLEDPLIVSSSPFPPQKRRIRPLAERNQGEE